MPTEPATVRPPESDSVRMVEHPGNNAVGRCFVDQVSDCTTKAKTKKDHAVAEKFQEVLEGPKITIRNSGYSANTSMLRRLLNPFFGPEFSMDKCGVLVSFGRLEHYESVSDTSTGRDLNWSNDSWISHLRHPDDREPEWYLGFNMRDVELLEPFSSSYRSYALPLNFPHSYAGKIWDVLWVSYNHKSHGRFPVGSSSQTSMTLMSETIYDKDCETIVEAANVRVEYPEVPLMLPPELELFERRLNSFHHFPGFAMKHYFMAEPFAKCGFTLMEENVIKCVDRRCAAQHFLSEVLMTRSRDVAWHIVGCAFAAFRKPCKDCIGLIGFGSDCADCEQPPKAERTFHHLPGSSGGSTD